MYIGVSRLDDFNLTLSRLILGLKLNMHPFSLSTDKRSPLSILLSKFNDALDNRVTKSFFLSSIDPGRGKSSACIAYIRAWKASGFQGEGSILIAAFTLKEIEDYISGCGLDNEDFAVLIGFNQPLNNEGRGPAGRNSARILFTTHNMLLSRSIVHGFEGANDLSYNGRPRTLRIWDEGIDAAPSASIYVESLMGAIEHVRDISDAYADTLSAFVLAVLNAPVGTIVDIPVMPKLPGLNRDDDSGGDYGDTPRLLKGHRAALRSLHDLAGMKARIGQSGKKRILYGYGQPLSADLAPMIITDASGRVRETYRAWHASRGDLVMLPSLVTDYRNLDIHLAVQAVGKDQLRDPVYRDHLLRSLGKLIDSRVHERWLIIHPLIPGFDLQKDMKARVLNEGNVRSTHWGLHRATNDFSTYENVIVIGAHPYKELDYKAMLAAAEGKALDADDSDRRWTDIRRGEFASNLLQAVCRVNVRNVVDGVCGKASAYVILPKSLDPRALMEKAFPGASIKDWGLRKQELAGRAKQVADQVIMMLRSASRVAKKEVGIELGISSQQLTLIWKKPLFAAYLREHGVEYVGRHFIKAR